jgi:hypothetical protein
MLHEGSNGAIAFWAAWVVFWLVVLAVMIGILIGRR